MTRMQGQVVVDAPVEEVFDLVADERNEPTYNPRIAYAAKLTDGAVGEGSRFLAVPRGAARRGAMLVEVREYDRPRRLRNVIRSADMEVDGTLTFSEAGGGTRLDWDWDVRLVGPMRVLSPALALVGPRWERRNWLDLKRHVEADRL